MLGVKFDGGILMAADTLGWLYYTDFEILFIYLGFINQVDNVN